MIGTVLDAVAILLGGTVGLLRRKPLSAGTEGYFKVVLGALTVFYGLRLCWINLSGSFGDVARQIALVILALMLGKALGSLCRLQRFSNRLGQRARENLSSITPNDPERFSKGFRTCAGLFCAAPLGILGATQEGLSPEYFYPLAIKAAMDGLASAGFVLLFGRGVLLAALPVLAFQGTITLGARALEPVLNGHDLVHSISAVGGLLVFCVALVMLGLKRIQLADYLPSLVVAPLLSLLWR